MRKKFEKLSKTEESDCFDQLRKLYIKMAMPQDVWEEDEYEPEIDAD